jgi:glycosyltransferase involved in cell wall biosynthesis
MKNVVKLLGELNKVSKFDLVHFNGPHIWFGKLSLPTVSSVHSVQLNEIRLKLADSKTLKTPTDIKDLVIKNPVGAICDILMAHATDKIICPAHHLVDDIRSYCFVDERKICVIPNGMDLDAFRKVKNNDAGVLSKYNLEKDKYLLYIGRLTVLKGVQYLIEAFRKIKKDYPQLKLVIVGTGDYADYLRNLSHELEDILFTGHVNSVLIKKVLYKNCYAVVVPSLYEGLPLVVLEAMASGKAVVASDVGGISTLIKHGKNGFLVKPRDVKGFEKFIRILLEDTNLRKKQGSISRKLVEKEFSIDKMVDRTLDVYKSLLTRSFR